MLRQIIGGGLVMGTATFLGWTLAGRLTRRPVQLRGLQTAIAVLQSEIEWGQTPLPAALRSAATAAGSKVEALLREAALLMEGGAVAEAPAAAADGPSATSPIAASPACSPKEALRQAITRHGPGTSLTAEDLAILSALAPILGATGRHDQSRHLALAKERLSGAEAMARADLERYERLARWGPVLVGAAIVLILS